MDRDAVTIDLGVPGSDGLGAGTAPAAAVTALYAEHALGLTRLALIMVGDRPTAEDIVQDAGVRGAPAASLVGRVGGASYRGAARGTACVAQAISPSFSSPRPSGVRMTSGRGQPAGAGRVDGGWSRWSRRHRSSSRSAPRRCSGSSRVLLSGPRAFQANPVAVDGDNLLFTLSPKREHPNGSYLCGHLALAKLSTSRITGLPFPVYCSTIAPPQPIFAAW